MLCEICKKNRATLHIKSNFNGVITEHDVCSECYNKQTSPNYGGALDRVFESLTRGVPEARCSVCSTKLSSILDTLYVGCPACYKQFSAYILPTIKNVQNAVVHLGKRPLSASENLGSEYERLKGELDRAIEQENYEQAAIISARLRQIRSETT